MSEVTGANPQHPVETIRKKIGAPKHKTDGTRLTIDEIDEAIAEAAAIHSGRRGTITPD